MIVREAMRGQAYVQYLAANFEPKYEVLLEDYASLRAAIQKQQKLDRHGAKAPRDDEFLIFSNCSAIPGKPLPNATAEGILGLLLARKTAPLPKAEQKPLYIRAPDAKLPKAKL